MYALIWNLLPGPWPVKALLALILFFCVVVILFTTVFPAIAPHMPFNDASVEQ